MYFDLRASLPLPKRADYPLNAAVNYPPPGQNFLTCNGVRVGAGDITDYLAKIIK